MYRPQRGDLQNQKVQRPLRQFRFRRHTSPHLALLHILFIPALPQVRCWSHDLIESGGMPQAPGTNVKQLLERWRNGDAASFDAASDLLYNELHRIAQAYLRGTAPNTLQPTALINEAYVRLVERSHGVFRDRKHFFALAAKVMRQILVDRARARSASKRGGENVHYVSLDDARDGFTSDPDEFLLLHQALDRL